MGHSIGRFGVIESACIRYLKYLEHDLKPSTPSSTPFKSRFNLPFLIKAAFFIQLFPFYTCRSEFSVYYENHEGQQ
jgi:hypothetical protein